jgi:hypothetical protein
VGPALVTVFEGKKFMWDGAVYADPAEAEKRRDAYGAEAFEVKLVPHEGKVLLYTRRLVKQTAAAEPK